MKFLTLFSILSSFSLLSIPMLVKADGLERASPTEIHQYVRDATEDLKTSALKILSVCEDQRTFENSLQAWNQCAARLKQNIESIESCRDQEEVIQATQELFSVWTEILQYPELQSVLRDTAIKILNDDQLDVYQRYIAQRFLENSIRSNNSDHILHIQGNAQEKRDQSTDFKILNFRPEHIDKEQVQDLAEKIISANAEVVLIQDAFFEKETYSLYEALKNEYCHFYILESPVSSAQPLVGGSLFVASKYPLEDMQYHRLPSNEHLYKEGMLDFVIKNGKNSVGRLYCIDIYNGPLDELRKQKMREVLEMMQKDFFYSIETECIPYVLCGDSRNLTSDAMVENYFRSDDRNIKNGVAILRSVPLYPQDEFGQEFILQSSLYQLLGDQYAVLSAIKKSETFSIKSLLNNYENYWVDDNLLLAKGEVSVSGGASADNRGNSNAEAGVRVTRENDNGTCCSLDVHGRVDKDGEGNKSAGVEVEFKVRY